MRRNWKFSRTIAAPHHRGIGEREHWHWLGFLQLFFFISLFLCLTFLGSFRLTPPRLSLFWFSKRNCAMELLIDLDFAEFWSCVGSHCVEVEVKSKKFQLCCFLILQKQNVQPDDYMWTVQKEKKNENLVVDSSVNILRPAKYAHTKVFFLLLSPKTKQKICIENCIFYITSINCIERRRARNNHFQWVS